MKKPKPVVNPFTISIMTGRDLQVKHRFIYWISGVFCEFPPLDCLSRCSTFGFTLRCDRMIGLKREVIRR